MQKRKLVLLLAASTLLVHAFSQRTENWCKIVAGHRYDCVRIGSSIICKKGRPEVKLVCPKDRYTGS